MEPQTGAAPASLGACVEEFVFPPLSSRLSWWFLGAGIAGYAALGGSEPGVLLLCIGLFLAAGFPLSVWVASASNTASSIAFHEHGLYVTFRTGRAPLCCPAREVGAYEPAQLDVPAGIRLKDESLGLWLGSAAQERAFLDRLAQLRRRPDAPDPGPPAG